MLSSISCPNVFIVNVGYMSLNSQYIFLYLYELKMFFINPCPHCIVSIVIVVI